MTILADAPVEGAKGARVVDADNPWPGLDSFQEQDRAFFRGRQGEADELQRLVHRDSLSILFGPSGLGKTSLLQAGLSPRLREENILPVPIRLVFEDSASALRAQVLDAVHREAAAHGVEWPEPVPGESLWEYFHRQDAAFWDEQNRQVIPLLVFDQFEEAFTLGRESRQRELRTAAFLTELGDLIENRPSRELKGRLDAGEVETRRFLYGRNDYRVLLVVREDFLADLEALKSDIPSVMNNRMALRPLNGEAALLVTGAGGPGLVSPEVGERIVRKVAGEDDDDTPLRHLIVDPALLSLFCSELAGRRAPGEPITLDLVEVNRDEILAQYYARSIADLGPAVRQFLEERLLTRGGHRNSEALENALAPETGITREALNLLIARRLIRQEDRDRRTRIELTHDVLTRIVRQSRDVRRTEETVAANAAAEQARAEREREESELRARANRERAERLERETRLVHARFRIVAVSAFLCLGLAAFAWSARNQAQDAKEDAVAGRLRADSLALRALLETNKAIAAAAHAEHQKTRADSLLLRATSTADSLRQTVTALTAAQDSVREEHLKAIVEREAADHYLRIAGRLRSRQLAQDSVRQLFGRDMYERDAEADSLRSRVRALEQELCKQPATAAAPDASTQAESRANAPSIMCATRAGGGKAPGAP